MAKIKGLKAEVETHPQYQVPRRLFDIQSPASDEEPAQIAESLLKTIATEFKIKPDLSQLKFDRVKQTILGSHVLYQQYYQGKPISGAWVRVDIDNEGRVYHVQNDLIPETVLDRAEGLAGELSSRLSDKDARKRALAALEGSRKSILGSELVYFPHHGVPTLAWKVVVKISRPAAEWKVYIEAVTGEVLEKVSLLKKLEGKGRVFDPNPIVTLNNTRLKNNSKIPRAAYIDVPLRDLKAGGKLDGPYVTTKKTVKRVKRKSLRFLFSRSNRAFKEVMVYFHIDRAQRHIQEIGFNNVLNRPIAVNISGTREDNSYYSPTTKSLTFGTGGVDDAEDAEVILHEYGHAIQDDQIPGFGESHEAEAMGEGFGDFLAATFFAEIKSKKMKPAIASWDAVVYSEDDPPNMRRVDSKKKYPKDVSNEPHDDGEIWSACLWQLRTALGRTATERLIIAHHFLLTRHASFKDAAHALILTDQNLNRGANEAVIRKIFERRGILPKTQTG